MPAKILYSPREVNVTALRRKLVSLRDRLLKVPVMLINIPFMSYFFTLRMASGMKALQLATAMMMMACSACSYLRWHEPDSAAYPAVRDLAPAQQTLRAADEASPYVLLTVIGRISYTDFEAPFWYVAYRPFQAGLKRVLILAGIQGGGIAGVDYLLDAVGDLSATAPGSVACDMDILPIVNPWGYVFNLPFSRNEIDIGRDFATFDSPEARVIRRFLRAKQYDLVIDLREDPDASGFSVWQYGLSDDNVSARIVSRIRSGGFPVENDTGLLLLKPRDGIVAAPMWGLTFLRLFRQLTLAGYVRQNVSSVVYTVVTPQRLPLADRVAMQRMAVETLINAYRESP